MIFSNFYLPGENFGRKKARTKVPAGGGLIRMLSHSLSALIFTGVPIRPDAGFARGESPHSLVHLSRFAGWDGNKARPIGSGNPPATARRQVLAFLEATNLPPTREKGLFRDEPLDQRFQDVRD
jgi:hypothetical protein